MIRRCKLHSKNRSYHLLSLILLTTILLGGCAQNDFHYVKTTVAAPETPVPWSNSGAFTYSHSKDGVGNVVNWAYLDSASEIFPYQNQLYFYGHYQAVRYDPETGRQTYLCTDPLCTHYGEGCPFAYTDLSDVYVCGDKILYYGISGGVTTVMLYSTTDRTTKVMRTIEGDRTLPDLIAMEEWYYFVDLVYDEKKDTYIRSLCRQFYDSGEIEVILTEDENRQRTSLMGTDGEVVYLTQNGNTVIVMSADGQKEITRFSMDTNSLKSFYKDEYMIYMDGTNYELWKSNLDGTGVESLGIKSIDYFYLTDSYIYYMKTDKTETYTDFGDYSDITDDESSYVEFQTIYRCDHNGENEEVVFENTVGDDVISLDKFNSFIVQGNYLYGIFTYHDIEKDKAKSTTSRLTESYTYCRIDCTTGEVYYIEVK